MIDSSALKNVLHGFAERIVGAGDLHAAIEAIDAPPEASAPEPPLELAPPGFEEVPGSPGTFRRIP